MIRCLFCRRQFDAMPFYGCCCGCYLGSAEVRAIVDDAHPQTLPQFDRGDSRVPDIDALLDAEFAKAAG